MEGNDPGGWEKNVASLALETSQALGPAPRQQVTMERRTSSGSEYSGLLAMVAAGNLPVRSDHEQLWELSMATQYSLAAATCQCLAVAALCIAVSNLGWIMLETTDHEPLQKRSEFWVAIYIFGVPIRLKSQQWLNQTSYSDIILLRPNQWVFIHLMLGMCFLGVLTGFVAFLLDFIEIKKLGVARLIISSFLHILSAVLCALVLVFCTWLLTIIQTSKTKELLKVYHYASSLGESFYLTIGGFILASLASIFSIWSLKLYEKDSPPVEDVEESTIKSSHQFRTSSRHTVVFS
ncbi:transmembrane protein 127-like [Pelodiscus sinensis]|uniref:transmembrane protein 127-like n=1 Tax=Pelodiscus sinensis TaxID=13735 RepID=UPI000D7215F4|nr:transmembrane protein 127-like isoform X2 [Pelodiscus sinensis]|eukprot:XP_025035330.1 transmembrane protein 127-like isoform X2 [Pelodiscus sinensis]